MAKKTLAEQADRHICYQMSVQSAEFEVEFFEERYRDLRKKEPTVLREDFCGTALVIAEWLKDHPERRAIGVDIDQPTLDWGIEHNLQPAGVMDRTKLLTEDVLTVETEKVDITCAMNFSYCCFKSRDLLRSYFENVRRNMNDDGLFFLDLLGGTETMDVAEDEREIEDVNFTYIWEQEYFNPVNHDMRCKIHFEFEDGSRIDDAFVYEWRLWTLPELREILLEAGFSNVRVFWEGFEENEDDPDDDYLEGTGVYEEVTEVEQQEAWLAYIVAEA